MFHRSERLLLRPGWQEDAGELTARIADEGIVRNLRACRGPTASSMRCEWLARVPSKPARLPTSVLALPGARGMPIMGVCGLHEEEHGAEIGYWIARDHWGRGYATEATRAVLSIARALGHRRVLRLPCGRQSCIG